MMREEAGVTGVIGIFERIEGSREGREVFGVCNDYVGTGKCRNIVRTIW